MNVADEELTFAKADDVNFDDANFDDVKFTPVGFADVKVTAVGFGAVKLMAVDFGDVKVTGVKAGDAPLPVVNVDDTESSSLALGPPPRYISPEGLRSVPLSVVEPPAVALFWVELPGVGLIAPAADLELFAAAFAAASC